MKDSFQGRTPRRLYRARAISESDQQQLLGIILLIELYFIRETRIGGDIHVLFLLLLLAIC